MPVPNEIDLATAPVELNIPVVKVKLANASVPLVNVAVPTTVNENDDPNVVVPLVELIVKLTIVALPLPIIVPVPTNVGVIVVYVPVADNVKLFKFNAVVPGLNAVVPKSNLLNQLPVVNVNTAVPLPVNVTFGALVADPLVVPNTSVLVTEASVVNPPVPVYVKLVTVAILSTICAAVVCAKTILFVPNAIDLVFVLLELNIPVVKSNPANDNVPLVSVVLLVAVNVNAEPNVVVPDVLLIVNDANVALALLVIVPVPTIVAVNAVNVPLDDNVKLFKFKFVVGTANAVVPKSSLLNQLAVVNVIIAVPEPVRVKFTELVAEPPVVPNVNVLVIEASVVKPPVPV